MAERNPSLYELLLQNFDGELDLHEVREEDQAILSVLDNLQRILNSRAGTLSHLPDFGLPDMDLILQGLPAAAHGLMGSLAATLLKYEPRLRTVNNLLISALVDIKAQPGWLIVVAGHSDATGNPEQNLQLSRARAAAVRNWMQSSGDFPDSCFAVQGFGASQPIADNQTEAGRAANRRVDISLVPVVGACV